MEPKWARFLVRNAQLSTRGFTDDIYAGTSVDDASMYFLALQHHFYGRVMVIYHCWASIGFCETGRDF